MDSLNYTVHINDELGHTKRWTDIPESVMDRVFAELGPPTNEWNDHRFRENPHGFSDYSGLDDDNNNEGSSGDTSIEP